MDPRRLAPTLLVCGLALLVGTALLGPALASPSATPAGDDPPDAGDGPRETLVGVQGVGSYTENGYVARLNGTREVWRESGADAYFAVSRLPNGSVLAATTSAGRADCGPYDAPCVRTGYRIVDPAPTPSVVGGWTFPVRSQHNSEVHDVEPLPGGGYVVADMDRERVVVVEDGEVTWEWRAAERYDRPDDPTRTDWLHINDVDRIGKGRFLVSVRNANQLVIVERGEGVVEVINGGPDDREGNTSVIHRQHNPQWLGDGAVLVADSENHRVVELHRTADGDWEPAWVLTGAGGTRFDWPRDADRLPNGNTLITDTRNARLVEVNESGAVVWQKRFTYRALPYEADRLPYGEPVGGPRYAGGSGSGGGTATPTTPHEAVDGTGRVPVLTPALRLVTAAVRVPRWFAEPHLLAVLLGVVATGSGAALGWLNRRNG
ncbi:MAG: hypothetical protein ABEJ34_06845 [Haloferacaceae archaeon]